MARPSLAWGAGAWLTVCAGLAAVVAYQLVNSFPLAPTVTAAPPSAPLLEPAERPDPPRSPRDDAVDEIAARPLFSEDRRPFEPPPAPVEQVAVVVESSLPVELVGTFLTPSDQAALLVVEGKAPEWLRPGQSIEGWEIGSIEQDRLTLLKGGQEWELQLRDDKAGPPNTARASGRDARKQNAAQRQQENKTEPGQEDVTLRDTARGLDETRRQIDEDEDRLSLDEDVEDPD